MYWFIDSILYASYRHEGKQMEIHPNSNDQIDSIIDATS